jgi:hypothetical protein
VPSPSAPTRAPRARRACSPERARWPCSPERARAFVSRARASLENGLLPQPSRGVGKAVNDVDVEVDMNKFNGGSCVRMRLGRFVQPRITPTLPAAQPTPVQHWEAF